MLPLKTSLGNVMLVEKNYRLLLSNNISIDSIISQIINVIIAKHPLLQKFSWKIMNLLFIRILDPISAWNVKLSILKVNFSQTVSVIINVLLRRKLHRFQFLFKFLCPLSAVWICVVWSRTEKL